MAPTRRRIKFALYLLQLAGDGDRPLHDTLAAFDPPLPLSLEIRSRALLQQYPDAIARAACVYEAAQSFPRTVPATVR